MVQKGVWLDPQAGLVMENYLLNKDKFSGTPGYPEEVFPAIKEMIPVITTSSNKLSRFRN
jgi:hypothetical protein